MEEDSEILKQLKILYVEDEAIIRENVVEYFEKRVKAIYAAENGTEAIRLYQEYQPNFILTDMEMPQMDGHELIRYFREELKSSVPILVISGYQDDDHHSDMADGYITKPLRLKNLAAMIADISRKRRQT